MVSKLTRVKNWCQMITHVKNWYQSITDVKNWYLIVTDVSHKTLKNWNRMQNAADSGVFYQCEEYACMLYEIWLRAYFSQSVRYWYEICDALVPIFHVLWGIGTNSSQCELYEVWNLPCNRTYLTRKTESCFRPIFHIGVVIIIPTLFLKKRWGYCNRFPPSVRPSRYLLLNQLTKSFQIWCVSCSHIWGTQRHKFLAPPPGALGRGQKVKYN